MTGSLILSVILLAIGFANLVGWGVALPLALIAIGVAIVLAGFYRRR